MSDVWTQPTPSTLKVQSRIGRTRYIFAVPFLIVGTYFLVQYFILGIIAYIRAGDWAGLTTGIPAWLLILTISLLFLVPGAVMLTFRRSVTVDTAQSSLTEHTDYLIQACRKRHDAATFDRLVIIHKLITSSRKPFWMYDVSLVTTDERIVHVGMMDREKDAEALAAALGAALALPVRSYSHDEWRNR